MSDISRDYPDQLPTGVTNTRDAKDARDASASKNVCSTWDMYVRGRAEMLVWSDNNKTRGQTDSWGCQVTKQEDHNY